jgi:hypothetical protein
VLRSVRAALGDDGTFLMIEFKFSSNLEANLDNPFAALYYWERQLAVAPARRAEGGAGLRAVWGVELARSMLEDAGFEHVDIVDSPARKTASSSAGHSRRSARNESLDQAR